MTTQNSPQPTSQALYEAHRRRRVNAHRGKGSEGEITYLNITPMLDMMTIILVFLLKSFATSSTNISVANLVLPHSTTKLNVDEALQMMITENEILIDQEVVTQLDGQGGLKLEDLPEGANGYLVQPLYDALENRASYFKRIEEFGGTQFNGKIAIIADKGTRYQTLFKVLYTAGRAEFGTFRLFVQKPE